MRTSCLEVFKLIMVKNCKIGSADVVVYLLCLSSFRYFSFSSMQSNFVPTWPLFNFDFLCNYSSWLVGIQFRSFYILTIYTSTFLELRNFFVFLCFNEAVKFYFYIQHSGWVPYTCLFVMQDNRRALLSGEPKNR